MIDNFLTWLNRTLCSHPTGELVRKFTKNRMYCECAKCGYETPGVEVGNK